jgi:hypothetical protein
LPRVDFDGVQIIDLQAGLDRAPPKFLNGGTAIHSGTVRR